LSYVFWGVSFGMIIGYFMMEEKWKDNSCNANHVSMKLSDGFKITYMVEQEPILMNLDALNVKG
jgi:hypothetical protein